MASLGKWMICGAIALPVGFGIGYALDARLPGASAKVVTSTAPVATRFVSPVAAKPAEPVAAPVGDRPVIKEPERAIPAPTPVAAPPPAPTPAPKPAEAAPEAKPAPVATPVPTVKAPVAAPAPAEKVPDVLSGLPSLKLPKGGLSIDDDEVKIRTPYGSFSFSL